MGIVAEQLVDIPDGREIYVATNPPKEICKALNGKLGTSLVPLRSCVDALRRRCYQGAWREKNDYVLKHKGYTSYGPAMAIVDEVMG